MIELAQLSSQLIQSVVRSYLAKKVLKQLRKEHQEKFFPFGHNFELSEEDNWKAFGLEIDSYYNAYDQPFNTHFSVSEKDLDKIVAASFDSNENSQAEDDRSDDDSDSPNGFIGKSSKTDRQEYYFDSNSVFCASFYHKTAKLLDLIDLPEPPPGCLLPQHERLFRWTDLPPHDNCTDASDRIASNRDAEASSLKQSPTRATIKLAVADFIVLSYTSYQHRKSDEEQSKTQSTKEDVPLIPSPSKDSSKTIPIMTSIEVDQAVRHSGTSISDSFPFFNDFQTQEYYTSRGKTNMLQGIEHTQSYNEYIEKSLNSVLTNLGTSDNTVDEENDFTLFMNSVDLSSTELLPPIYRDLADKII